MTCFHRAFAFFSALFILFAALPFVSAAADGAVGITPECAPACVVGGETAVRITVGAAARPLAAIEFSLSYDDSLCEPLIKRNTAGEMAEFVKKMPEGWEQICSLDESEHKYYLRFSAPPSGAPAIKLNGEIIVEIPFKIISAGELEFVCGEKDIVAVPADDLLAVLPGGGGSAKSAASGVNEKVSVSLSGGEEATRGGIYAVDIAFTNLAEGTGIIAAQFDLQYDAACFEPVITENGDSQMNAFMVSTPGSGWEQMCGLDAANARYELRFAAGALGMANGELLAEGAGMRFRVEFRVTGSEGATPAFTVPAASVIAVNNAVGTVSGVGSELRTAVVAGGGDIFSPKEYTVEGVYLTGVAEKTGTAAFAAASGAEKLLTPDGRVRESGLVCTGDRAVFGADEYIVIVRGDANGSGTVDGGDYAMAKRSVLGTFEPDETQRRAICVSGGAAPTAFDYAMIKRHVLGTFDINSTDGD